MLPLFHQTQTYLSSYKKISTTISTEFQRPGYRVKINRISPYFLPQNSRRHSSVSKKVLQKPN